MASTPSSSSSSLNNLQRHDAIDPELLKLLVTLINSHINSLISSPKTRKILQAKCTSKLEIHKQKPDYCFDFSEQSILSNLYWGIENVEAAIESTSPETVRSKVEIAERMLQAPAMLNENGITAGISNGYLVCCSYFYLSLVRAVQGDEIQVAVHVLQALAVAPAVVRAEISPEMYWTVVRRCIEPLRGGGWGDEGVRWGARSYKAWLMYHQVISYGESSLFAKEHEDKDKSQGLTNTKACSTSSSNSYEHLRLHQLRIHQSFEKVHPIDHQENAHSGMIERSVSKKVFKCQAEKGSSVKRLQDLLMEDESDSPTSLYSGNSDFADDDSEEHANEFERSLQNLRGISDEQQPERSITTSKAPETINISSFSGALASSLSEIDFWNSIEHEEEEEAVWKSLQSFQNNYRIEQAEIVEKVISKLCFSEGLAKCDEDDDPTVEITTVYEMLASKSGLKYSLLKDVILDQLLMALSSSKENKVTRASISILSSIINSNPSAINEIKNKGLSLNDLANALKRDVYEAAVLIYLINPTPNEIKTLELMPMLVKIICASNCYANGLKFVTPKKASLMMIRVLVSAFDYSTNNAHLGVISSPKVISCLVSVVSNGGLDELICLGVILVKCMRFDGQCRKYITKVTPVFPFISLILSNEKNAILVGLEFYHELLRMPRPSSVSLLQQLREAGGMSIMCVLLLAIQQTQQEYKLLAASLLLQLDVLEDSLDDMLNREVAIGALVESLTCEENSDTQQLAAFVLSNFGGTYNWTGEPYTMALLVKKSGLNSLRHKNIVKNIDWSDSTLQDNGTEIWCSKVARHVITLGNPVFYALEKGLKSKNKRVSRDCLTTIAWIGCEMVKGPDVLRCSACDILLSTIEQYVHPGMELEERLLACLCIYNYTFGRGMHKIIQFSEGVRESLRRLSGITWMAEELLKVADYYMPNKWRISCVHTQLLEANSNGSGAVNALIYYRGQLFSGHSNGSIKRILTGVTYLLTNVYRKASVWDIKGQTTTLVSDKHEHKKAVTCFTLFEQGNYLLSGSADKTIRIWQMFERSMQCIEVITMKDSIQSLETSGEMIFAVTHNHKVKVFDSSRKVKDVCKNKHVKCIRASQGKLYLGCMDSSIQELTIGNNRQQEIKAPSKSWRMQNKPINSIALYKDWLYSASTCVDGSRIKEWKRQSKAQLSIVPEKRANVVAMSIVEDFIYLITSSSPSNIEIWLRGTQHKVGRLTAGSKITSILTANDMVLCGTETGLIKGWIPL